MNIFDLLESSPASWLVVSALVGLLIGSFLNVVISRLPRMMEAGWKQECSLLLELDAPEQEPRRRQDAAAADGAEGRRVDRRLGPGRRQADERAVVWTM